MREALTQIQVKPMATEALCKPETKLHILLMEETQMGEDPVVWEMDYDGTALPGIPHDPAQKLHEWLNAKHICPCGPRQYAEHELARKVEELARSNRELEQFAYVASHDLREPLRMVAAYTQLLGERYRGKLDENADKYIGYATDGAARMQTLIQDLLTLSRVRQERDARGHVDCNAVVEDIRRDLAPIIEESQGVVNCEPLPVVRGDRTHLVQVFQNLIGNALKFHEKGKSPIVAVRAREAGPHWVFSVSDNGIGIAAEERETIFAIFRRLHVRSEYPGNGIGLAICQKIVEHNGGRIWVDSKPGGGSTFSFTWPADNVKEKKTAQ